MKVLSLTQSILTKKLSSESHMLPQSASWLQFPQGLLRKPMSFLQGLPCLVLTGRCPTQQYCLPDPCTTAQGSVRQYLLGAELGPPQTLTLKIPEISLNIPMSITNQYQPGTRECLPDPWTRAQGSVRQYFRARKPWRSKTSQEICRPRASDPIVYYCDGALNYFTHAHKTN